MTGEHALLVYLLGILCFYAGVLPAYRVLMVWVYDRTGSLPVAMLMHASLSASTLILQPPAAGTPFLTWNFVLAAVMWGIVAAVGLVRGGHPSRPRLPTRAATLA